MKFINDYLRLIVFCSGLLIGVQIPAVVNEYEKRVDAHLTEASQLLVGFKHTADRYFNGDLLGLIEHYKQSADPVFNADANNIQLMVDRVALLQQELAALHKPHIPRVLHVLFSHDQALMSDTLEQYSYVILIDISALAWGILIGLIIAASLDGIGAGIRLCYVNVRLRLARYKETSC
jgi:hypothetical protein